MPVIYTIEFSALNGNFSFGSFQGISTDCIASLVVPLLEKLLHDTVEVAHVFGVQVVGDEQGSPI